MESLDTLLDAYEEMGENIPHFLQYQAIFVKNEHMREVSEMVYNDILAFHERALRFFRRKSQYTSCNLSPSCLDLMFHESLEKSLQCNMENISDGI